MNEARTSVLLLALLLFACGQPQVKQVERPADPAADTLRLGLDAYDRDEYQAALGLFADSFGRYRSVDDVEGMLLSLVNRAEAALAIGRHDVASRSLDRAERLLRFDRIAGFAQRIRLLRARTSAQVGDFETAAGALETLLEEPSLDTDLGRAALLLQARVAVESGDADAAGRVAAARAALADVPGYQPAVRKLEGDLAAAGGDHDAALAAYEEALNLYRERQDRRGIATTYEAWGRTLIESGDLDAADDRLRRALDIRLWITDRARSLAILDDLIRIAEAREQPDRVRRLMQWRERLAGQDELDGDELRGVP